ncbi:MAG: peptidoglycan recognition protein family protein [Phycisphaerales bacterium]|nr:peptidoglycan recognition protein family protein [Phycisphaerales bacterium]
MDEQVREGSGEESPLQIRRRDLLRLLGIGLSSASVLGCATRTTSRRLPGPDFPTLGSSDSGRDVLVSTEAGREVLPFQTRGRRSWTAAQPNYADMNRMAPIRHVTVHHDGMRPFWDASATAGATRLDLIRRGHLRRGWADIGYHFAIDRGGTSWACRPLNWQGAHVEHCNEGNVGIVVLGNFEEQQPSRAQLLALRKLLGEVTTAYRIPAGNVRTHQEWPSAATACPGRHLQFQMNSLRA